MFALIPKDKNLLKTNQNGEMGPERAGAKEKGLSLKWN